MVQKKCSIFLKSYIVTADTRVVNVSAATFLLGPVSKHNHICQGSPYFIGVRFLILVEKASCFYSLKSVKKVSENWPNCIPYLV